MKEPSDHIRELKTVVGNWTKIRGLQERVAKRLQEQGFTENETKGLLLYKAMRRTAPEACEHYKTIVIPEIDGLWLKPLEDLCAANEDNNDQEDHSRDIRTVTLTLKEALRPELKKERNRILNVIKTKQEHLSSHVEEIQAAVAKSTILVRDLISCHTIIVEGVCHCNHIANIHFRLHDFLSSVKVTTRNNSNA